jgi:anti-sigma regulatory factor (Ser/Thr protein kinase)
MKRTLEFASHPGNLGLMREFVRKFLAPTPLTTGEADLIVLGIDEACTNIIRHAYDGEEARPIFLTCEQDDRAVTFRLRDIGRQCDPAKLCGRALDEARPGGLGIHLIKKAFDEVRYDLKTEGTELVLGKFFGEKNL